MIPELGHYALVLAVTGRRLAQTTASNVSLGTDGAGNLADSAAVAERAPSMDGMKVNAAGILGFRECWRPQLAQSEQSPLSVVAVPSSGGCSVDADLLRASSAHANISGAFGLGGCHV
ncbi:MAG: hypothetical protein R3D05_14520 [Dongiaceae bacterium]